MCYLTGRESCPFWRYSWLIENLRDVSQVEKPKDASKAQILRGGHGSFLINSVVKWRYNRSKVNDRIRKSCRGNKKEPKSPTKTHIDKHNKILQPINRVSHSRFRIDDPP